MRETILAATNKSEAFNEFVQWIFFYNNGEIQENLRHEQNKMIKYNHLVANLVILHNVNSMTKVIKGLRKDGPGRRFNCHKSSGGHGKVADFPQIVAGSRHRMQILSTTSI